MKKLEKLLKHVSAFRNISERFIIFSLSLKSHRLQTPGLDYSICSISKWNHQLKATFCVYSGYLCFILQFIWWYETFKWPNCKKPEELRKCILFTVAEEMYDSPHNINSF